MIVQTRPATLPSIRKLLYSLIVLSKFVTVLDTGILLLQESLMTQLQCPDILIADLGKYEVHKISIIYRMNIIKINGKMMKKITNQSCFL